MQGCVMEWKLFHRIYARITTWKRYLVGNSGASSFFGSKIAALNFRKLFIEIEDKVIYGFAPNIKTIVV